MSYSKTGRDFPRTEFTGIQSRFMKKTAEDGNLENILLQPADMNVGLFLYPCLSVCLLKIENNWEAGFLPPSGNSTKNTVGRSRTSETN
jgi:hypothetical protein